MAENKQKHPMYTATTRNIKVNVFPSYLPEQSDVAAGAHSWAYFIRLENMGEETVQLINRYWKIVDAHGHVQEVRGAGVVGEQPVIKPGESYSYTSGVPLSSPSGLMQGHYGMVTSEGEMFMVEIPAFSLDSPEQIKRAN
jgi:ApaG protein